MSTSMLRIKPEDVDSVEKRKRYTVSVVSCKQIGILHACLFAEAGFKVICVDFDQHIVNSITKGKAPFLGPEIEFVLKNHVKSGDLKATNDMKKAVAQSDITVIATSVKIGSKGKPNYFDIENACRRVGPGLHRGSLVIIVGAVGPGIVEGLVKETLENTSGFKVGVGLGLAFSPTQVFNGQTLERLQNSKRIVAAMDKASLNAASTVLRITVKDEVVEANDVKTVETAALFEAVHDDVNLALANELAVFCEKIGVDYFEAKRLMEAGTGACLASPLIASGKFRKEPYVLLEEAENLNVKLRTPTVARETNEEMLKHAISLIIQALRSCGKPLRRAKISLLGVSQIPNLKYPPGASVKRLVKKLAAKGTKVIVYDPYFSSKELMEMGYPTQKTLTKALEGADCVVILTGHERLKRLNLKRLKVTAKMPVAIVDFGCTLKPDKVEKEGFIYRGLGRGGWTT
jgi:UDP-N-acetyl-D-mannosaminuronic acid dehydrogenase